MALVKILSANLFAGASFQKLEAGAVYDVDDAVAEKWISEQRAEKSTDKKGLKLSFEVSTPSAPVAGSDPAVPNQSEAVLVDTAKKEK